MARLSRNLAPPTAGSLCMTTNKDNMATTDSKTQGSFRKHLGRFLLLLVAAAGFWILNLFYQPIAKARINMALGPEPELIELTAGKERFVFRDLNKNGQIDPYEDHRLPTAERVGDLLSRMTLEEKIGQMFHPPVTVKGGLAFKLYQITAGSGASIESQIADQHIRHFNYYGFATPEQLAKRLNELQSLAARTRLGIPLNISSDPIHEVPGSQKLAAFTMQGISKWPSQLGLAATRDSDLVAAYGRIAAAEYRAMGLHTALHPMADLATEPRWARHFGTFGSNADLSSQMTLAYMRGYQGPAIDSNSVLTMVKHFPGGGPQEDGLDPHLPSGRNQVYPAGYFNYHLAPFVNAINAGLRVIMPYYGIVNRPDSENVAIGYDRDLLTDLLREQLGFDGVVCSDWSIVSTRYWGVEDLSIEERYQKAIDAGIDQFGGESGTAYVHDLVKNGLLPEPRIDASVRRILTNTFDLGLFEQPFVDESAVATRVNRPEHVQQGLEAQRRSVILLSNKENEMSQPTLPLPAGTKIFVDGLDHQVAAQFGDVVAEFEAADYVILFLPSVFNDTQDPQSANLEHVFVSMVIPDGDLEYPQALRQKVATYAAARPLIVIADLNRPAILDEILTDSAALLGTFGVFDSVALEAVFGMFNPSGRLPFEIPSSMDAVRGQLEDLPDDSEDPTFRYGDGLSYRAADSSF